MDNGGLIIQELTGAWPVYPGHPLVVATAIMKVFPDFASANRTTPHGWCEALADARIPGAGDHVGAAMRVLAQGAAAEPVEAMVAAADEYWRRGNAGGHTGQVDAGLEQAAKAEPHFRAAAAAWFNH